jgi:hypothetical protein
MHTTGQTIAAAPFLDVIRSFRATVPETNGRR